MLLACAAMGTRFELVLDGDDPVALRAAGEAALEEIRLAERELSRFRKDSFLAHVERHAARRPVPLPADLFELFCLCRDVHERSGGAFDVTVAPLLRRHGLDGEVSAAGPDVSGPVGFEYVELDPSRRTIRLSAPVKLDLGAVGKGHGLEQAAGVLRARGIERALLHGGTSTVVALGTPPDQEAWRIPIRDPRPRRGTLATALLRDTCLSVSAIHGRQATHGDRRVGHVMDPRDGRPVEQRLLAAVVTGSAALADAWSTALLVSGDPEPVPGACLLLSAAEGVIVCDDGQGRFEIESAAGEDR